ncbi:uncharacterized protein LOC111946770 [Oryzias latipes]|uniref:uncharacterized protein LOC111946770 n=1 Tax=Oryzias latipes TaxID=8090 RepID=UPI000CE17EDB|nr:uncharacterized protein LOC111946770 [Oryzias latipes]
MLVEQSYPVDKLKQRYSYLHDVPVNSFSKVQPHILIGSDNPFLITPTEQVRYGPKGSPAAVKTRPGWALQGPTFTYPDPVTPNLLLMGRRDASLPQAVYADTGLLGRRKWRHSQVRSSTGAAGSSSSQAVYAVLGSITRSKLCSPSSALLLVTGYLRRPRRFSSSTTLIPSLIKTSDSASSPEFLPGSSIWVSIEFDHDTMSSAQQDLFRHLDSITQTLMKLTGQSANPVAAVQAPVSGNNAASVSTYSPENVRLQPEPFYGDVETLRRYNGPKLFWLPIRSITSHSTISLENSDSSSISPKSRKKQSGGY